MKKLWLMFFIVVSILSLLGAGICLAEFRPMPPESEIIKIIKTTMEKDKAGFEMVLGANMADRVPLSMDIIFKEDNVKDFKWEDDGGCSMAVWVRVPVVVKGGIPGHLGQKRFYDPQKYYQYYLEYWRGFFFAKAGNSYTITRVVKASDSKVVSGPNKRNSKGQTWLDKFVAEGKI